MELQLDKDFNLTIAVQQGGGYRVIPGVMQVFYLMIDLRDSLEVEPHNSQDIRM